MCPASTCRVRADPILSSVWSSVVIPVQCPSYRVTSDGIMDALWACSNTNTGAREIRNASLFYLNVYSFQCRLPSKFGIIVE